MTSRLRNSHLTTLTPRAQQLAQLFLAKKESAGHSPHTIANYRRALGAFLAFPGTPADPDLWTDGTVDLWIAARRRDGGRRKAAGEPAAAIRPATLAHDQRHVLVFIRWLYRRGDIPADWTPRVERVQVPRSRGRVARPEVHAALALAALRTRYAARNLAIIELLWESGLRRSELARLNLEDVDFERALIRMPAEATKKRRERLAVFDPGAKAALIEYVIQRGQAPGPLFLSATGTRLSSDGIRQMIEGLARSAEVDASSHDFRRGFAGRMRREGLDVADVMRLLGHTTPAMTLLYSEDGEDEAAIQSYRQRRRGAKLTG